MHRLRRVIITAGVMLCLVLLSLGSVSVYLLLDKDSVFDEVRGTYQGVVTLESRASAESKTRRLQLRNDEGVAVAEVYFRRPVELDPDYRIVLMYAGAKTRDKILTLIPERSDLVLLSVQYPYESPHRLLEYLRWPYHIRRAGFRSVAGGMLAMSFLQREERLDLGRLSVVGVSVGVPFATIHGALDERVPNVVLIHGGGDLLTQVRAVYGVGRFSAASLMAAVLFHSFEPLHYVDRIAPRKLVIIAARDDTMLPRETVEKLYAMAGEPKQLIWTESGHVRSNATQVIAEIVRLLDRHL